MSYKFDDLQVGERVRYVGEYYHNGKLATVIHRTEHNTAWRPNQYKDDYVPIQFDLGGTYGAYRRNLERIQEIPNWEL